MEPWSGFRNIVDLAPLFGKFEIGGIYYNLNAETGETSVISKSGDKYSGEIVIPESVKHEGTTYSVTSIGEYAFYNSTALKDVYCYAEKVPSTDSYAFSSSIYSNAILPVPAASIESYKTTEPWNGFGTIKALSQTMTLVDGEEFEDGEEKVYSTYYSPQHHHEEVLRIVIFRNLYQQTDKKKTNPTSPAQPSYER